VEDDDGEYIVFAFLAAILHYHYRRKSQFSSSRRSRVIITNTAKSKQTQVFVLKNSAIEQTPRFDIQEIDIKEKIIATDWSSKYI
jgi:hypothetical protein